MTHLHGGGIGGDAGLQVVQCEVHGWLPPPLAGRGRARGRALLAAAAGLAPRLLAQPLVGAAGASIVLLARRLAAAARGGVAGAGAAAGGQRARVQLAGSKAGQGSRE